MSNNIPQRLNTCLVVDPICDFVEPLYAVEKAPQINNFYNISSNSKSIKTQNFNIPINSIDTIVDRVFLLDCEIDITVQSLNAGLYQNRLALSSFPLSKWIASLTVTVGNASNTIQLGSMMNCFERYGIMDKFKNYSMTPVFPDLYNDYESGINNNGNPLAGYANNWVNGECPRGAFPYSGLPIMRTANTDYTFRYRLVEPLFISPFLQSLMDRKQGFSHLQNIQVQINFGNPKRLFKTVAGDVISIPSFQNVRSPEMRMVQYVPGLLDLKAPAIQTLAYNEIVQHDTPMQELFPVMGAGGGNISAFTSPSIQLSRIPKEFFVYCRHSDDDYNSAGGTKIPDTFAALSEYSLVITFNGQTFLSGASNPAIYKMCVENGCNLSYLEWVGSATTNMAANPFTTPGQGAPFLDQSNFSAGTVGSVICCRFGKDVPLTNASWAPGCSIKSNLQIQASFTNTQVADLLAGGVPNNFVMYVVVVYEGAWSFYGANTVAQTAACLTEDDVLNAVKENNRVHYDLIHDDAMGGSIFSRAKSFLQSGKLQDYINKAKSILASDTYKSISGHAKNFARSMGPTGKAIADTADSLGLGVVNNQANYIGSGFSASGMSGGKKLTKAALKRMLMN